MDKIPASAQIVWAKIMKFPDFSPTSLVFKISWTLKKNQISPTFPWPVATLTENTTILQNVWQLPHVS